jgi:hypothetical protein
MFRLGNDHLDHEKTTEVTHTENNSLTPEVKLHSNFSSGRNHMRISENFGNKVRHNTNRSDNEGNETLVTSEDYHHQMAAMDDKITKLENLVWSLYKELNSKIETATANFEYQLQETAQSTKMVFGQLGEEIASLKTDIGRYSYPLNVKSDEGYEGSEEESPDPYDGEEPQQVYMQGSLDKVDEELNSQDYSKEGNAEFLRNSTDRSDPLIDSSRDRLEKHPYDYQVQEQRVSTSRDNESERKYEFEQEYVSPHFYENVENSSSQRKGNTTPDDFEGEGDLEYYFSCHERMVHSYNQSNASRQSSDVFQNLNKDELKENHTAPDLSRSTLVDQIDFDLDNYKLNESSLYSSGNNSEYNSNKKANLSCNLRENKRYCADVKPKLMGFLNSEKVVQKSGVVLFRKSSLEGGSSKTKTEGDKDSDLQGTADFQRPFLKQH